MKLTDAQIRELAPEWATHCKAYDSGGAIFENSEFYQRYGPSKDWGVRIPNPCGLEEDSMPIPRKLPNSTAVLRSEVKTQADLDAMVKVAEYNGFDMSVQHEIPLNWYGKECIYTDGAHQCLQAVDNNKELNIITLKEFLSYGENRMEEINEAPIPPVKPPKKAESQAPIEQIADIMRREGITSLTLHMISTGQVTGSFDVESGVKE